MIFGSNSLCVAVTKSFGNMIDASSTCGICSNVPHVCNICWWRRYYVIQSPGQTDAPTGHCDFNASIWPQIAKAAHEEPPPIWKKIIETNTLCSPSAPFRRTGSNYLWVSFQLRCPSDVEQAEQSYFYKSVQRKPTETVLGYHNTKLQS